MDSNRPCLKIEKVILGAEAKVCWTKIERIWCLGSARCIIWLEYKVQSGKRLEDHFGICRRL